MKSYMLILLGLSVLSLSGCGYSSTTPASHQTANKAANQSVGSSSGSNPAFVESITLPQSFKSSQDGYPVGLYWALENVMSKHNGYDLSKELGRTVKAYKVNGHLVFEDSSGKVIGDDEATATFQQLTNQSVNEWIESQYGPYSAARLKMTPEETIRAFYQAINEHNNTLAWSYADPVYTYNLMGSQMSNGLPNSKGWQANFSDQIEQIEVLSIKTATTHNTHIQYSVPTKFFEVTTKGIYKPGMTVYQNGVNTWVVEMVKPSANSPWMYSGTPTGGY